MNEEKYNIKILKEVVNILISENVSLAIAWNPNDLQHTHTHNFIIFNIHKQSEEADPIYSHKLKFWSYLPLI